MQATLVALYGDKNVDLKVFLTDCQSRVGDLLGRRFRRYDIRQIHGTIMGLERDEDEPHSFFNRNFKVCRDATIQMDFLGLLRFLSAGQYLPFQVQIGGFKSCDYSFSSRGESPFNRSFSIQDKNVVIMGWPSRRSLPGEPPGVSAVHAKSPQRYPGTLDALRRGAQRYGFLHTYHAQPGDADNDFFFRIGIVDNPASISSAEKSRVEDTMRNFLAETSPLIIDIALSDLDVVFYDMEELPLDGSTAIALEDDSLNEGLIRGRYRLAHLK